MFTVDYIPPDLPALAKQGFVADMHFHTSYSHDCQTPIVDIIKMARKLQTGVAITDHNRIGGAIEALRFKDVSIIPGIEICSKEGKDIIAYFYDGGQLQEFYEKRLSRFIPEKNPLRSSRTSVKLAELIPMLSEEECVVCLPHPFAPQPRTSYRYLSKHHPLLSQVDVIEVFNQTMTRRANLSALGWAVQLRRSASGGSDGHALRQLGHGVTVSRGTTVQEHLDAMTRGDVSIYGTELKAHQRALNYATTSVRTKLQNGVTTGVKKGLTFPMRASRRLIDGLKR